MQKQLLSIFMLSGFFFSTESKAQQTLNVSGHSARVGQYTFDYSIGEMSLVSTERNANLIITQGMLQPNGASAANSVSQNQGGPLDGSDWVRVYPNPTSNLLYVETAEAVPGAYSLRLLDATGKLIWHQEGQMQGGTNKFSLNVQSYAGGQYFLLFTMPSTAGDSKTLSYTIQKLN